MAQMNAQTKEEFRKNKLDLIRQLQSYGLSETDANITADLMIQAKAEAFNKMEQVCELAPLHLRRLVFALTIDAVTNPQLRKEVDEYLSESIPLGVAMASVFSKLDPELRKKVERDLDS